MNIFLSLDGQAKMHEQQLLVFSCLRVCPLDLFDISELHHHERIDARRGTQYTSVAATNDLSTIHVREIPIKVLRKVGPCDSHSHLPSNDAMLF